MKEETKEVTDNKYKEEQMRRKRWKGGKETQRKRRQIWIGWWFNRVRN